MIALVLSNREMPVTRQFEFNLSISAEQTERLYQGHARYIMVHSIEGLKLQLPAQNFKKYVSGAGIQGQFRVKIDADNKIINLQKLA